MKGLVTYLFSLLLLPGAWAFTPRDAITTAPPSQAFTRRDGYRTSSPLYSSAPSDTGGDDYTAPTGSAVEELERCKASLVGLCDTSSEKPSLDAVRDLVNELEGLGEQVGIGQASSNSGLLSGEW